MYKSASKFTQARSASSVRPLQPGARASTYSQLLAQEKLHPSDRLAIWLSLPRGARQEVPEDNSTLDALFGAVQTVSKEGGTVETVARALNAAGIHNAQGRVWSGLGVRALIFVLVHGNPAVPCQPKGKGLTRSRQR